MQVTVHRHRVTDWRSVLVQQTLKRYITLSTSLTADMSQSINESCMRYNVMFYKRTR